MPATILLDIPPQEQEQMLAALRRARYGDLLAFKILARAGASGGGGGAPGQDLTVRPHQRVRRRRGAGAAGRTFLF